MQRRPFLAAVTVVLTAFAPGCSDDVSPVTKGSEPPHWGYEGDHGPEVWGELTADYAACSHGLAQSPIDLGVATPADLPDLTPAYEPGDVSIGDNGHTVQATATGGTSSITVDGTVFTLLQMHFHIPSEHTIDGEFAPAEVHFVHRSDAGELAVLGVMLDEGPQPHAAWSVFTDAASVGEGATVDVTLDWPSLLPSDTSTIRYAGSLTTPPCTEGVRWMVMDTPVLVSGQQLEALSAAHEGNHRPVQAVNGRAVSADTTRD
jgi:carbonic anhydrase